MTGNHYEPPSGRFCENARTCIKGKNIVSINHFNPFKPNGIPYYSQLDRSVSVLRGVGWYFSFFSNFDRK